MGWSSLARATRRGLLTTRFLAYWMLALTTQVVIEHLAGVTVVGPPFEGYEDALKHAERVNTTIKVPGLGEICKRPVRLTPEFRFDDISAAVRNGEGCVRRATDDVGQRFPTRRRARRLRQRVERRDATPSVRKRRRHRVGYGQDGGEGMGLVMTTYAERLEDIKRFYSILEVLEDKIGGRRKLAECSKASGWPTRGVYFFMEEGEVRTDSGDGLRIVRVGSHATKTGGAKTSLWTRLRQHRSGRVYSSVFRNLIGRALYKRGDTAKRAAEPEISEVIGQMPFLWLEVQVPGDVNRGVQLRNFIERNSIKLLSNYRRESIDGKSGYWLGNHCTDTKRKLNEKVIGSGLWNQQHVSRRRGDYKPDFLDKLDELVTKSDALSEDSHHLRGV